MAAAVSMGRASVTAGSERVENEALIELAGVSKDYDSGAGIVRAMREVNLRIDHGEFVAIVGTSGSGKSTMMNILGCLDRPTHGRYSLAGIDAGGRGNDARALVRNRLIGFIFQGFNLLPRTTALENVELPLQYRGIASRTRRKKALAVLESVGLADRGHHKPNELSGGQQQRVAIARALVTDPPLLLADEPTGNLDTRTSLEVLALLQRLNKDSGITIVLVTHEHDIAACASRVITMRDGRIVSDVRQETPTDAAEELANLPAPNEYGPAALDAEIDPVEANRRKIGGPVPFSVYAAMFGAAILGLATGIVYNAGVLGRAFAWFPPPALVLMLLAEVYVGARVGRRRIGRSMTSDQRVRLALWYTIGELVIAVPFMALVVLPKVPVAALERFEHMASGGIAVTLLVVLAGLAAVSLLRYLLLTLFNPKK